MRWPLAALAAAAESVQSLVEVLTSSSASTARIDITTQQGKGKGGFV